MSNPFDDAWEEWLNGSYRGLVADMPPDQRWDTECAFYAGAAFGGRVATDHGHDVVIEAIKRHIERGKRPSPSPGDRR